jgi:hypothetical protein
MIQFFDYHLLTKMIDATLIATLMDALSPNEQIV